MKKDRLQIVILGLSITSSWGNGHATTYRCLIRELKNKGHDVVFLERDTPWYKAHRDLPDPEFCHTILYNDLQELKNNYNNIIREADIVIVGSYVPDGVEVGNFVFETSEGITAFYDIDTPVTLAKINNGDFEYLHPKQISQYDMYLSFTGGPTLDRIEQVFGSPMARPLYCSFDASLYYPEQQPIQWDIGYLGTYSDDRQPALDNLMLKAALKYERGNFVVAGPKYPETILWPQNVQRIEHLPPSAHRKFYNSQRFTLNITRADMIEAGFSPSVRLFEAAACGTPIISDYWEGIDQFFEPGKEILISRSTEETLYYLHELSAEEIIEIGKNAKAKVLSKHSAENRVNDLENYYTKVICQRSMQPQPIKG